MKSLFVLAALEGLAAYRYAVFKIMLLYFGVSFLAGAIAGFCLLRLTREVEFWVRVLLGLSVGGFAGTEAAITFSVVWSPFTQRNTNILSEFFLAHSLPNLFKIFFLYGSFGAIGATIILLVMKWVAQSRY